MASTSNTKQMLACLTYLPPMPQHFEKLFPSEKHLYKKSLMFLKVAWSTVDEKRRRGNP